MKSLKPKYKTFEELWGDFKNIPFSTLKDWFYSHGFILLIEKNGQIHIGGLKQCETNDSLFNLIDCNSHYICLRKEQSSTIKAFIQAGTFEETVIFSSISPIKTESFVLHQKSKSYTKKQLQQSLENLIQELKSA